MEQVIVDFLSGAPPEVQPVIQWAASDFDHARPVLVLGFVVVLLLEVAFVAAVYRAVTR